MPIARAAARLGTDQGRLDLEIYALGGRLTERISVHATTDPLEVPAIPAALVAAKLLSDRDAPSGFASASEVVTRGDLVDAITARGGRVDVSLQNEP